MTKRFLLFAGENYYPCGGWADFISAFPCMEEAVSAAHKLIDCNWWHIVDLEEGAVVNWGQE